MMKNKKELSRRRFISGTVLATLWTVGVTPLIAFSAGNTIKNKERKLAAQLNLASDEPGKAKIASDSKTKISNLKAGTGRANITPPVGAITGGNPAIGIDSELFAKALVLDDGQARAALVTVDIILLDKKVVAEIRKLIEEMTGIPGSNVMLAASHNHSGPSGVMREAWGYHCNIEPDNIYIDKLITRIAGAVAEACSNMTEVKIGAGEGRAPFNINRWIPTPNGPSGAKWGPYPDGPTDETLSVLRIDRMDGTPLAAVVNFAAHASVANWGKYLSADFPGFLQETMEKVYDGKMTAMFINGASGDLKIKWLTKKKDGSIDFAYGGVENARRWGRIIGGAALTVMEQIETTFQPCRITLSGRQVDLPMLPFPTAREIEMQIEARRKSGEDSFWEQRILPSLLKGNTPMFISGEVQLLRLGDDISLLAIPGELFAEIGLRMRRELDCNHLFIAGYANGYTGYLPSSSSCLADGKNLRYDWHKTFSYPASFSEGVEPALMSAVKDLFGK
ncbi:MAG: neutral/alkaline non-lysosomal ceramidase N-terminal domain-containing protein [Bacteroidales bacterium]|nr:neutral/alkaline non-lysosomal ceramidase N-terminal domain-containing protein [Bacteroidales bacterium]